jgi:hypothetical protein
MLVSQSKIRFVAIVYTVGALGTALVLAWAAIDGGALTRPRPDWQDWAVPLALNLAVCVLWPIFWGLWLLQLVAWVLAPVTLSPVSLAVMVAAFFAFAAAGLALVTKRS